MGCHTEGSIGTKIFFMKRITETFLEWILNPEWSDDILGDLEELYYQNLQRSTAYAEYKFFIQGLLLLRPSLIRKINLIPNNNTAMFSNYFKTGIRSLLRNKLSASINVIGLALGLSVFLLLTEYVHFESTYDSHLETSDQLYRVTTTTMPNGKPEVRDAMASYLVGRELYEAIPEITGFTVSKLFDPGMVFRIGENVLQENKVIAADSNFFRLFPYEVIAGNPENFLSDPGQIVLTQTKAEEYFGSIENAIGQTIELPDAFDRQFVVSGVVQDIPKNTHYKFEIAISDPSTRDLEDFENWNYNNHYVYVLLDEHTAANNLQDKLDAVHFKIHNHNKERWELGKVTDIHLSSNHTFEPEATGSKTAVTFMKYIAFFILVIAWINYINLSTARAMDRAKEVGIRKVSGAYKSQLVGQFLTEAFIVNLAAAILAIAITSMAAPFFNFLAGASIIGDIWQMDLILRNALIFFLLGTILSGFYPALILSRYRPNEVLKGRFSQSGKGVFMRKSLVTVQFAASIILISGTLIVRQQVEYMMNQDLGIDTEQIISFRPPEVYDEETAHRSDLFKEKLMEHSAIVSIGKTSNEAVIDNHHICCAPKCFRFTFHPYR
jgi:putative ABC transport system permease protein